MKFIGSLIALCLLTFSATGVGAEKESKVEDAQPGAGLTIFMDVSIAGRKNRAAKRMTDLHRQHRAKGWVLIDVEPYIENGDLEGFFISYVRSEEKQ